MEALVVKAYDYERVVWAVDCRGLILQFRPDKERRLWHYQWVHTNPNCPVPKDEPWFGREQPGRWMIRRRDFHVFVKGLIFADLVQRIEFEGGMVFIHLRAYWDKLPIVERLDLVKEKVMPME